MLFSSTLRTFLTLAVVFAAFAEAMKISARRPGNRRNVDSTVSCRTNAECIRNNLPLMRPRERHLRRDPTPVSTDQTCGVEKTLELLEGAYTITLSGGQGGTGGGGSGGVGAVIQARLNTTSLTSLTYYIGCAGLSDEGKDAQGDESYIPVGGGGGGTFLYIKGPQSPALLVAGGGGGAGSVGTPLAGRTDYDSAYSATGAGGASDGTNSADSGGGGGGFKVAGSTCGTDVCGKGGSSSPNYGGNFSGGARNKFEGGQVTGGAGGGGGGGWDGGGGGGGYTGGNGGYRLNGGQGGGSYASNVPGILVTVLSATASRTGNGGIEVVEL